MRLLSGGFGGFLDGFCTGQLNTQQRHDAVQLGVRIGDGGVQGLDLGLGLIQLGLLGFQLAVVSQLGGQLVDLGINTEISAGFTPPILVACASVVGRILASFSRVSVEMCSIFE